MKQSSLTTNRQQIAYKNGKRALTRTLLIFATCSLLIIAGCSKSPDSEMHSANAAVDQARTAGAEMYAPAEWSALQDSIQSALQMKKEQDDKFAMFRSYDESKEHFVNIEVMAKMVATQAETAKQEAKSDAEALAATAQQAIDATSSALAKSMRSQTSKENLDKGQNELTALTAMLADANGDFKAGNYLPAKNKFQEVVDRTGEIGRMIANLPPPPKPEAAKPKVVEAPPLDPTKITWVSYDIGLTRARNENKHVLVDFTTSWCGWCKKMDAETFSDPAVIKLMNENFVNVKVIGDSERRLDIDGRKISEEALTAEFGVRGFPCFAFLTAEGENLGTIPGYRPKDNFVSLLNFVKDKKYLEEMKKQQGQSGSNN